LVFVYSAFVLFDPLCNCLLYTVTDRNIAFWYPFCVLPVEVWENSCKSFDLYVRKVIFLGNSTFFQFFDVFSHRNYGSTCVVLGYYSTYFSNKIQKGKTFYSEEQVISMLEFLIDNIFVSFGGTLFQQVVGIPMKTNCAPLLTDLFLCSYQSEFLQKLVKDKKIHEDRA